jgi:hypothetical protein
LYDSCSTHSILFLADHDICVDALQVEFIPFLSVKEYLSDLALGEFVLVERDLGVFQVFQEAQLLGQQEEQRAALLGT